MRRLAILLLALGLGAGCAGADRPRVLEPGESRTSSTAISRPTTTTSFDRAAALRDRQRQIDQLDRDLEELDKNLGR